MVGEQLGFENPCAHGGVFLHEPAPLPLARGLEDDDSEARPVLVERPPGEENGPFLRPALQIEEVLVDGVDLL